jgi:hypothetical protein
VAAGLWAERDGLRLRREESKHDRRSRSRVLTSGIMATWEVKGKSEVAFPTG